MILVARELPRRPQDRFGVLLEFAPTKVEPQGYTVGEFRGLLARGDPQLLGAFRRRELLAALSRREGRGRPVAEEGPAG